MNLAFPTQEVGYDTKLNPIMSAREQPSELASSISTVPTLLRPKALSDVSKPSHDVAAASASARMPQVGKDTERLLCMNNAEAIDASSFSSCADLNCHQHQQQEQQLQPLSGEEPPSKVSIANSLLSFKQTTARKIVSADDGMCTNYISSPNPKNEDTPSTAIKGGAAKLCTNNSNFWLQEEEERFL